MVLPWLGIEMCKWGVLPLAMWPQNKRGSIKFGRGEMWDFVSTFVLDWFSSIKIGFWSWFDCVFDHNSISVWTSCHTYLSSFQLCFVVKKKKSDFWTCLFCHYMIFLKMFQHDECCFISWNLSYTNAWLLERVDGKLAFLVIFKQKLMLASVWLILHDVLFPFPHVNCPADVNVNAWCFHVL